MPSSFLLEIKNGDLNAIRLTGCSRVCDLFYNSNAAASSGQCLTVFYCIRSRFYEGIVLPFLCVYVCNNKGFSFPLEMCGGSFLAADVVKSSLLIECSNVMRVKEGKYCFL